MKKRKNKKKIVAIDDQKDFLKELKETLQITGYQPYVFSRASQALREIKKIKPDVILLDLRLGKENGVETALQLKNEKETKSIPVIIMTAFYDQDDYRLLKQTCQIEMWLKKPLKPLDIIAAIEKKTKEV